MGYRKTGVFQPAEQIADDCRCFEAPKPRTSCRHLSNCGIECG